MDPVTIVLFVAVAIMSINVLLCAAITFIVIRRRWFSH